MATGPKSASLQAAINIAIEYLGLNKKTPRITDETVDAVLPDGTVLVGGNALRTSGVFKGMKAGDKVRVGWSRTSNAVKKPKRTVILAHQVRRNIPPPPTQNTGTDNLVEELFVAQDASGRFDVWFRDAKRVINLFIRSYLDGDPTFVKWGTREDSFVVATNSGKFYIFTFVRVLTEAMKVNPLPKLIRIEEPFNGSVLLTGLNVRGRITGSTYNIGLDVSYNLIADPVWNVAASFTPPYVVGTTDRSSALPTQLFLHRAFLVETPKAVISDICLNDDLDLIFVVSANPSECTNTAVVPGGKDEVPAFVFNGEYGADENFTSADDDPPNSHVYFSFQRPIIEPCSEPYDLGLSGELPQVSRHTFVVNTTKNLVLYATCPNPLTRSAEWKHNRFSVNSVVFVDVCGPNGVNNNSFGGQAWMNTDGTGIWEIPGGNPFDEEGGVSTFELDLGNTNASNGLDVVDDSGGFQSYGFYPVLQSGSEFEPKLRTLLGDPSWTETSKKTGKASHRFLGIIWAAQWRNGTVVFDVNVTGTVRSVVQEKTWTTSGQYIPSRVKGKKGRVLLKIIEDIHPLSIPNKDPLPTPPPRVGFFIRDLDADTLEPLVPLTPNSHSSQGVGLDPFSSGVRVAPETDQLFVTLGVTKDHILYLEKTSAGAFDGDPFSIVDQSPTKIVMQELRTKTAKTVVTALGMATGLGVSLGFNPGLAVALKKFLKRCMTLMRPDVIYEALLKSKVDETSDNPPGTDGEQFVVGWENGYSQSPELTDPPLTDVKMSRVGLLKDLPEGVVPIPAEMIAYDGGPVNVYWPYANSGPSFHMINNVKVLGSRGRFELEDN